MIEAIKDDHPDITVSRYFQWFLNRQVSLIFTPSLTVFFGPPEAARGPP